MRFLVLLLMVFLLGCTKKEDGFTIYKIGEGKHSSNRKIQMMRTDYLSFDAKCNSTAMYESIDPVNQYDINKLYGFSDCNQLHQKNSARFGWRWLNGELEILAYVYNDGVRDYEYITSVGIGETHHYEIHAKPDKYIFILDNKEVQMDRTNRCEIGFYYMLFPYFGGDEVAPHDINIYIKEQKN